jgi:hypothetical protein
MIISDSFCKDENLPINSDLSVLTVEQHSASEFAENFQPSKFKLILDAALEFAI